MTSDAGAAEEWLTKYGEAGKWAVVYGRQAKEYTDAINYLTGKPSEFGAICKP